MTKEELIKRLVEDLSNTVKHLSIAATINSCPPYILEECRKSVELAEEIEKAITKLLDGELDNANP